jgi:hypothetical protein
MKSITAVVALGGPQASPVPSRLSSASSSVSQGGVNLAEDRVPACPPSIMTEDRVPARQQESLLVEDRVPTHQCLRVMTELTEGSEEARYPESCEIQRVRILRSVELKFGPREPQVVRDLRAKVDRSTIIPQLGHPLPPQDTFQDLTGYIERPSYAILPNHGLDLVVTSTEEHMETAAYDWDARLLMMSTELKEVDAQGAFRPIELTVVEWPVVVSKFNPPWPEETETYHPYPFVRCSYRSPYGNFSSTPKDPEPATVAAVFHHEKRERARCRRPRIDWDVLDQDDQLRLRAVSSIFDAVGASDKVSRQSPYVPKWSDVDIVQAVHLMIRENATSWSEIKTTADGHFFTWSIGKQRCSAAYYITDDDQADVFYVGDALGGRQQLPDFLTRSLDSADDYPWVANSVAVSYLSAYLTHMLRALRINGFMTPSALIAMKRLMTYLRVMKASNRTFQACEAAVHKRLAGSFSCECQRVWLPELVVLANRIGLKQFTQTVYDYKFGRCPVLVSTARMSNQKCVSCDYAGWGGLCAHKTAPKSPESTVRFHLRSQYFDMSEVTAYSFIAMMASKPGWAFEPIGTISERGVASVYRMQRTLLGAGRGSSKNRGGGHAASSVPVQQHKPPSHPKHEGKSKGKGKGKKNKNTTEAKIERAVAKPKARSSDKSGQSATNPIVNLVQTELSSVDSRSTPFTMVLGDLVTSKLPGEIIYAISIGRSLLWRSQPSEGVESPVVAMARCHARAAFSSVVIELDCHRMPTMLGGEIAIFVTSQMLTFVDDPERMLGFIAVRRTTKVPNCRILPLKKLAGTTFRFTVPYNPSSFQPIVDDFDTAQAYVWIVQYLPVVPVPIATSVASTSGATTISQDPINENVGFVTVKGTMLFIERGLEDPKANEMIRYYSTTVVAGGVTSPIGGSATAAATYATTPLTLPTPTDIASGLNDAAPFGTISLDTTSTVVHVIGAIAEVVTGLLFPAALPVVTAIVGGVSILCQLLDTSKDNRTQLQLSHTWDNRIYGGTHATPNFIGAASADTDQAVLTGFSGQAYGGAGTLPALQPWVMTALQRMTSGDFGGAAQRLGNIATELPSIGLYPLWQTVNAPTLDGALLSEPMTMDAIISLQDGIKAVTVGANPNALNAYDMLPTSALPKVKLDNEPTFEWVSQAEHVQPRADCILIDDSDIAYKYIFNGDYSAFDHTDTVGQTCLLKSEARFIIDAASNEFLWRFKAVAVASWHTVSGVTTMVKYPLLPTNESPVLGFNFTITGQETDNFVNVTYVSVMGEHGWQPLQITGLRILLRLIPHGPTLVWPPTPGPLEFPPLLDSPIPMAPILEFHEDDLCLDTYKDFRVVETSSLLEPSQYEGQTTVSSSSNTGSSDSSERPWPGRKRDGYMTANNWCDTSDESDPDSESDYEDEDEEAFFELIAKRRMDFCNRDGYLGLSLFCPDKEDCSFGGDHLIWLCADEVNDYRCGFHRRERFLGRFSCRGCGFRILSNFLNRHRRFERVPRDCSIYDYFPPYFADLVKCRHLRTSIYVNNVDVHMSQLNGNNGSVTNTDDVEIAAAISMGCIAVASMFTGVGGMWSITYGWRDVVELKARVQLCDAEDVVLMHYKQFGIYVLFIGCSVVRVWRIREELTLATGVCGSNLCFGQKLGVGYIRNNILGQNLAASFSCLSCCYQRYPGEISPPPGLLTALMDPNPAVGVSAMVGNHHTPKDEFFIRTNKAYETWIKRSMDTPFHDGVKSAVTLHRLSVDCELAYSVHYALGKSCTCETDAEACLSTAIVTYRCAMEIHAAWLARNADSMDYCADRFVRLHWKTDLPELLMRYTSHLLEDAPEPRSLPSSLVYDATTGVVHKPIPIVIEDGKLSDGYEGPSKAIPKLIVRERKPEMSDVISVQWKNDDETGSFTGTKDVILNSLTSGCSLVHDCRDLADDFNPTVVYNYGRYRAFTVTLGSQKIRLMLPTDNPGRSLREWLAARHARGFQLYSGERLWDGGSAFVEVRPKLTGGGRTLPKPPGIRIGSNNKKKASPQRGRSPVRAGTSSPPVVSPEELLVKFGKLTPRTQAWNRWIDNHLEKCVHLMSVQQLTDIEDWKANSVKPEPNKPLTTAVDKKVEIAMRAIHVSNYHSIKVDVTKHFCPLCNHESEDTGGMVLHLQSRLHRYRNLILHSFSAREGWTELDYSLYCFSHQLYADRQDNGDEPCWLIIDHGETVGAEKSADDALARLIKRITQTELHDRCAACKDHSHWHPTMKSLNVDAALFTRFVDSHREDPAVVPEPDEPDSPGEILEKKILVPAVAEIIANNKLVNKLSATHAHCNVCRFAHGSLCPEAARVAGLDQLADNMDPPEFATNLSMWLKPERGHVSGERIQYAHSLTDNFITCLKMPFVRSLHERMRFRWAALLGCKKMVKSIKGVRIAERQIRAPKQTKRKQLPAEFPVAKSTFKASVNEAAIDRSVLSLYDPKYDALLTSDLKARQNDVYIQHCPEWTHWLLSNMPASEDPERFRAFLEAKDRTRGMFPLPVTWQHAYAGSLRLVAIIRKYMYPTSPQPRKPDPSKLRLALPIFHTPVANLLSLAMGLLTSLVPPARLGK